MSSPTEGDSSTGNNNNSNDDADVHPPVEELEEEAGENMPPPPVEDEDEDEPFEDANEVNEFDQYFVNEEEVEEDEIDEEDEVDEDDFFVDEENEDDADVEIDQENENIVDEDIDDDENEDDDEMFGGIPHLVNNDEYDNVDQVQVNYDTELPSTHNYLGTNFSEVVSSKRVHASNDEIELPLLPLPGTGYYENESEAAYTQLIPGQVMPVFFYSPLHVHVIRRRMRDNEPTVGFVLSPKSLRNPVTNNESSMTTTTTTTAQQNNDSTSTTTKSDDDPKLGIIAEILSISNEEAGGREITDFSSLIESGTGLILKLKGRERFRIVRLRKDITGCYMATVRILAEYVVTDNPMRSLHNPRLNVHIDAFMHKAYSLSKAADRLSADLPQPCWLYRYYDCAYLVEAIKRELRDTFGQQLTVDVENVTSSGDVLVFSYWLLANFPFDNRMRIECLRMDCINHRLIYMYSLLRNFTNISCRRCDNVFCTKHDVFSISKQGFMSAYLNPGGVVHETLTVYKMKNFSMTNARPSTQNTWFPGYGWQICYCGRCNCHIGWKFTPTKPHLKPDKFWGLTRTAIKYTYNQDMMDEEDNEAVAKNPQSSQQQQTAADEQQQILALTNDT